MYVVFEGYINIKIAQDCYRLVLGLCHAGPLLFSPVLQVTTNTHCRYFKQDVAAKQEPPENENEFSPSLTEARGRSQAPKCQDVCVDHLPRCHGNIP